MSKVSMPRPRYVAFEAQAALPLSRRAVGQALRAAAKAAGWADDDGPHLTRYAWPHGIVRVDHRHLAACRKLLAAGLEVREGAERLGVRVTTLSSSGTLKALTGRLGILADRAPQS